MTNKESSVQCCAVPWWQHKADATFALLSSYKTLSAFLHCKFPLAFPHLDSGREQTTRPYNFFTRWGEWGRSAVIVENMNIYGWTDEWIIWPLHSRGPIRGMSHVNCLMFSLPIYFNIYHASVNNTVLMWGARRSLLVIIIYIGSKQPETFLQSLIFFLLCICWFFAKYFQKFRIIYKNPTNFSNITGSNKKKIERTSIRT